MTLRLNIEWGSPSKAQSANSLCWGKGILYINDDPYWYQDGREDQGPQAIQWTWIDLLEWLSINWISLRVEQAYPLGLNPVKPTDLRRVAEDRWRQLGFSAERTYFEDSQIFNFEEQHDLSRAMQGINLPSLLLVREGQNVWVSTDSNSQLEPLDGIFRDLSIIGDLIAAQAESSDASRAKSAVTKWKNRDQVTPAPLFELVTGWSKSDLSSMHPLQKTMSYWELGPSLNADSEITSAARFLRGTPSPSDRISVLNAIKRIPKKDTTLLDELSQKAISFINSLTDSEPYIQGYELARWLRTTLDIAQKADPQGVIKSLKVSIVRPELSIAFDAIGCWGPKHGPAVLINSNSPRVKTNSGCRATLAHELCHLLVDRCGSLPLAEVLGGKVPYRPERRANAFAAEFLLPREGMREILSERRSLRDALVTINRRYGVGQQLTLQHIHNDTVSFNTLSLEDQKILDRATGNSARDVYR